MLFWRKNLIPQPGNEPGTSWLLSYRGTHAFPPNNSHHPVTIYICTNLQVVTFRCERRFLSLMKKVSLDCLNINWKIDVSDSLLVLFWRQNLIPQQGNEPRTSQVSFECSTYWATGEPMPSLQTTITIWWLYIFTNLQVVTFSCGRRFLSSMKKVTLDCLNINWKIDVSDSLLVLFWRENLIPHLGNKPGTSWLSFKCSTYWAKHLSKICQICQIQLKNRCLWQSLGVVLGKKSNSSARKQTWDLLVKLRVLYLVSYWGTHAFSPNNSHHSVTIYMNQPAGGDFYLW